MNEVDTPEGCAPGGLACSQIPYMLVIGDKEIEKNEVAVRSRSKGDLGTISVAGFVDALKEEIASHGEKVVALPEKVG